MVSNQLIVSKYCSNEINEEENQPPSLKYKLWLIFVNSFSLQLLTNS